MKVKPYIQDKSNNKILTPKIVITNEAYEKLYAYSKAKQIEIMLFGVIDKKDNIYTILDFVVPPQTSNSGTFVTTDDEAYSKWLHDMDREDRQKLRLHFHTHPNMNTTPSGTDQTTIKDKVENITDYYIRMIGNEKQEYHIDLYDITNKLHYEEIEMYLLIDDTNYVVQFGKHAPKFIFTDADITTANKLLDEKIKKEPKTPYNYEFRQPFNPYSSHSYFDEPTALPKDPILKFYAGLMEDLENNIKVPKENLAASKHKDLLNTFNLKEKEWNKLKDVEKAEYIEDYCILLEDLMASI